MQAPESAEGISVRYLSNDFLDEVQETGFSLDSTVYDIEDLTGSPGLIRRKGMNGRCPIDGEMGAAYVHCLDGDHNVGPATHMLSYTWGYTIQDIVGALVDFYKKERLDQETTYFWICFLCVNQHRVAAQEAVPTKLFLDTFGRRVANTNKILCMMSPWQNPLYLQRIWCIYEISRAFATQNCKVIVVLPPAEKMSLVKDLLLEIDGTDKSPVDTLYDALNSIKVEEAKASQQEDREYILSLLETEMGGHESTNKQVKRHLKEHLLSILMDLGKQCKAFDTHTEVDEASTTPLEPRAHKGMQGLPELVMRHRRLRVTFSLILLIPIMLALAWGIHAILS